MFISLFICFNFLLKEQRGQYTSEVVLPNKIPDTQINLNFRYTTNTFLSIIISQILHGIYLHYKKNCYLCEIQIELSGLCFYLLNLATLLSDCQPVSTGTLFWKTATFSMPPTSFLAMSGLEADLVQRPHFTDKETEVRERK